MSFLDSLGLGYAIAVALGFLAALLLASYFCFRRGAGAGGGGAGLHHSARHAASSASSSGHISITVPRFVFVAEDDSPGSSSRAAAPVGLDPAVIASYPKVPFSRAAGADAACSICLCEYREGEMQRVMPECRHRFHLMCLDAWLHRSASCPVCRSSPIPTPVATPLATPLSELVPLSQYAADRRRHRWRRDRCISPYLFLLCTVSCTSPRLGCLSIRLSHWCGEVGLIVRLLGDLKDL